MQHNTFQSYFDNLAGPIDIEALMAFHRNTFAGYTMEDEPEESDEPAGEDADQESSESNEQGDESGDEQAPDDEEGNEGEDEAESELTADDARKVAKKARKEAANWRTKYRDLEKKLEGAKTPAEVEEIRKEIRSEVEASNHALVVENVALKHRLPEDLAQVLADASAGKDREALEAHAKVLAKYAPADEEDESNPSGGLNPEDGGDGGFDPVKRARELRKQRRY